MEIWTWEIISVPDMHFSTPALRIALKIHTDSIKLSSILTGLAHSGQNCD